PEAAVERRDAQRLPGDAEPVHGIAQRGGGLPPTLLHESIRRSSPLVGEAAGGRRGGLLRQVVPPTPALPHKGGGSSQRRSLRLAAPDRGQLVERAGG